MRVFPALGVALASWQFAAPALAAHTQAVCKGADRDLGFYYRVDLDDQKHAATITMVIPGYEYADANTPLPTKVVAYSLERIHLRQGGNGRGSPDAKPKWGVPLAYKRLGRSTNFVLDRIEGTMVDRSATTDENGRELSEEAVKAIVKADMERLYMMPDSAFEHGREYELSFLKFWALVALASNAQKFTCKKVTDRI